jgi:hypothetical protein
MSAHAKIQSYRKEYRKRLKRIEGKIRLTKGSSELAFQKKERPGQIKEKMVFVIIQRLNQPLACPVSVSMSMNTSVMTMTMTMMMMMIMMGMSPAYFYLHAL